MKPKNPPHPLFFMTFFRRLEPYLGDVRAFWYESRDDSLPSPALTLTGDMHRYKRGGSII